MAHPGQLHMDLGNSLGQEGLGGHQERGERTPQGPEGATLPTPGGRVPPTALERRPCCLLPMCGPQ